MTMAEYSITRARGGRAILALSALSTSTDAPALEIPDARLPAGGSVPLSTDETPAPEP